MQSNKTVQGLVLRFFADQGSTHRVALDNVLTKSNKSRVGVAFSAADRFFADVVTEKWGKPQLLFAFIKGNIAIL